jgi:diguanylate cyclase (GGDEF)-like protein/PAS domain S-box-containing protein
MQNATEPQQATLNALPTPAWVGQVGLIVFANAASLTLLEMDRSEQILGRHFQDFITTADQERARQRVHALATSGEMMESNESTQYSLRTARGQTRVVLIATSKMLWQGQTAMLHSGVDITHLIEVQHRLSEGERNFRRVYENMQDVYYRTNAQGGVQQVGPGVRRVLGYEPEEIVGRTAESYYPQSKDRDAFKKAIQERGEVSDFPGQMVRSDGEVIDISISSHALYDEGGAYAGVEGIYRDVTQRKNLERELHKLASTDMLTGLANRRALFETAESMFRQAGHSHQPLTLLTLDLDHFKSVNDRFGHIGGDRALVTMGEEVRAELRSTDLLGRTGGEEFVVLLPNITAEQGVAMAERILQRLRAKVLWPSAGEHARGITASVGVAERRETDQSIYEWLDRADKALYQAKQQGRDRVVRAT